MISTENVSPATSFTVSETPSSATEPLAAMKRASAAGARNTSRAMSSRSSRSTSSAMPSTWPATIWPPSSSPILERALEVEPGAVAPRPDGGDGERLGGGIGRKPGAAVLLAGADHREAHAVAGDRGAVGDAGAVIAAGDLQAPQIVGTRMDRDHLADIGDDAGEHRGPVPAVWAKSASPAYASKGSRRLPGLASP